MPLKLFRQNDFLDGEQCAVIRRAMSQGTAEDAEILQEGIHREGDVRRATLIEPGSPLIDHVEARLEACRQDVAAFFGIGLRGGEGVAFIRYPPGGFYRPHVDRGDDPEWPPAKRRAVALVVFLNSSRADGRNGDFDGGILRLFFPDSDVHVVPQAGLLVAFPADVLHEVTEVRGGTRDTIVDWFYDG